MKQILAYSAIVCGAICTASLLSGGEAPDKPATQRMVTIHPRSTPPPCECDEQTIRKIVKDILRTPTQVLPLPKAGDCPDGVCPIEKSVVAPKPLWHTSYNHALAEAKETGKPLLLYVSKQSCQYCRELDAVLKPGDLTNVTPVKLNATARWDAKRPSTVASVWRISGVPAFAIVDPVTERIRWRGNVSVANFRGILREHDYVAEPVGGIR